MSGPTATPLRLPFYVVAQDPVDACLITLIGPSVLPEPCDDVGIETERQLLLDWPVE